MSSSGRGYYAGHSLQNVKLLSKTDIIPPNFKFNEKMCRSSRNGYVFQSQTTLNTGVIGFLIQQKSHFRVLCDFIQSPT